MSSNFNALQKKFLVLFEIHKKLQQVSEEIKNENIAHEDIFKFSDEIFRRNEGMRNSFT